MRDLVSKDSKYYYYKYGKTDYSIARFFEVFTFFAYMAKNQKPATIWPEPGLAQN